MIYDFDDMLKRMLKYYWF